MEYPSDEDYYEHEPYWDWKEKDWQQYLLVSDSQINAFCVLYRQLIDDPLRLDKIAQNMGWTTDNIPPAELNEESPKVPYTMHMQPVYVLTRGIFRSLYELAFALARLPGQNAPLAMSLLSSLHEAEMQAILGIESQDMGDMSLTVCHFKRSLAQLNQSLGLVGDAANKNAPGCDIFAQHARRRIFDLREVWLKVNTEVRDEIQRRNGEP
jgi:hypothetical protein